MAFQGTSGDLMVSNCVVHAGLAPHISSLMFTETLDAFESIEKKQCLHIPSNVLLVQIVICIIFH